MVDHCIREEILLHKGDQVARGHVMAWNHDANGNIMGRAHMILTLDTKTIQGKFFGGKVAELTVNVIAESM